MTTHDQLEKSFDLTNQMSHLDSNSEQTIQGFTVLASQMFRVPVVIIQLISKKLYWHCSASQADSFSIQGYADLCQSIDTKDQMFQVADTSLDNLLGQHPSVTSSPLIRFCAASSLKTSQGKQLGSLYLFDHQSRTLTEHETTLLQTLARQLEFQLSLLLENLDLRSREDSTQRLRVCLHATGIGVWDWDIESNHLYWDDSMYKLYDINPQDFSGAYDAWSSTLHEMDKDRANQDIQLALADLKKFDLQFRIKNTNQEVRQIAAKGEVFFSPDHKPKRMIGVNWDVSKEVEQRLLFDSVFNNSIQPIMILDPDGRILKTNAALARILHYELKHLETLNIASILSIPGDAAEIDQTLKNLSQDKSEFVNTQATLAGSGGTHVPVLMKIQSVLDFSGKVKYHIAFLSDLTEIIKAEESYLNSERIFRKLFNFAPIGIALINEHLQFIQVNQAYQNMLNYSDSEIRALSFTDLTHPDHAEAINRLQQVFKTSDESKDSFIIRNICKDKSDIWVKVSYARVKADDTNLALCIMEDITSSRNAERSIIEAHDQLAAVFENMSEGLVIQGKSGEIQKCNPAALKILGLTEDEITGRTSTDPRWQAINEDGSAFIGTDHPAMVALATGKSQHSIPMGVRNKNNNTTWISISSTPIFEANIHEPKQVVTTFMDVTQAKNVESVLREKNKIIFSERNRFETFVFALNASAIVAKTDRKGIITYVNDKFCNISGWSREELIGKSHKLINSGTHSKEFFVELWKTISTGKVWVGEICNRKKDGSYYWVESTIVPLFDEHEEIAEFIAIRFETTNRKLLEEHLIASREMEVRANSAKSEFLSNMSHEIRTPLNGIIGMADLLKDTKLDGEQSEYTEAIVNSGKTLVDLINDILDLSKIESGKIELEIVETNLDSLIKSIIVPHQINCKSKGIDFQLQLPQLERNILVDDSRFGQIINNLLSNAIKFTEHGFVKLDIQTESEDPEQVTLSFILKDSGIGISKDNQQKLFKSFNQAESSISKKYGGTGLGLSIVKKLTELMGGTIRLESELGKGSTFTLNFTLKTSALATVSSDHLETKRNIFDSSLKGNILIAEDNPINQKIIRRMVNDLGCVAQVVENGLIALQTAQSRDFDLILMDCRMPEMDGYEATRAIRQQNKDVPIVAITANASEGEKELCFASGMNDFLSKPITKEKVFNAIEKYLAKGPSAKKQLESKMSQPKVDLAILDELMSMNSEDEPGFFEDQKKVFVDHSQELFDNLTQAINKNERKTIADISHSLKGSAANFGAAGLGEVCTELERSAASISEEKLKELHQSIKVQLAIFCHYLNLYGMNKAS